MATAQTKKAASTGLTPMMRQYHAAKIQATDAIMFFRMGDFYEVFYEDAQEASQLLELTLTHRGKARGEPIPMAGVPVANIETYIRRLLEAGKRVAICEQVEDASVAKGLVKREITRILSPGVRMDDEGLTHDRANYLVAIAKGEGEDGSPFGLAAIDVSTGDLRGTVIQTLDELRDEIGRLDPAEAILEDKDEALEALLVSWQTGLVVGTLAPLDPKKTPPALPVEDLTGPLGKATEALRAHLAFLHIQDLDHIRPMIRYSAGEHLILDATTLRNLEVFQTSDGKSGKGTLFQLTQRARSGPGGRTIRAWMRQPLKDIEEIIARQDAIAYLLEEPELAEDLREAFKSVRDMERITARTVSGAAHPRDLAGLRDTLAVLPGIRAAIQTSSASWMQAVHEQIDLLEELSERLSQALVENPPIQVADGGVIRDEYDPEIASLRSLKKEGANWFVNYEAGERERTGIPSLKVRYNKVFGYYIEVTKTHLSRVPENYVRKQTIANGERYFTPELKEREATILSAGDRLRALEIQRFRELRDFVAEHAARLQKSAHALGALDALCALANLSDESGYTRPGLHTGPEIEIQEGRHPTMERLLPPGEYVPNDITLGGEHGQLTLITGPNMAGKSSIMRQVALTSILAQIGAWVPASSARMGIVDRVFTRVGASDSITTGRSTFMVEMLETAEILSHATEFSLVLLDEIGRGTSTFDGLSLAWAVAEYLHDHTRARTLFATHYHELCELASSRDGVRNIHVSVRQWDNRILFLRRLQQGPMRRSYGIEVARLAGLPDPVVERARDILSTLEDEGGAPKANPGATPQQAVYSDQLDLFSVEAEDPRWPRIRKMIESCEPDELTPRSALELLYTLKEQL